MKLEVGKRYLTRDSRVVIIASITENENIYPIKGKVVGENRNRSWTTEGSFSTISSHGLDIVAELPSPVGKIELGKHYKTRNGREVWVNQYREEYSPHRFYGIIQPPTYLPVYWDSAGNAYGAGLAYSHHYDIMIESNQ